MDADFSGKIRWQAKKDVLHLMENNGLSAPVQGRQLVSKDQKTGQHR